MCLDTVCNMLFAFTIHYRLVSMSLQYMYTDSFGCQRYTTRTVYNRCTCLVYTMSVLPEAVDELAVITVELVLVLVVPINE